MCPGDVGGGGHVQEAGQAVEVVTVAVGEESVGLATEDGEYADRCRTQIGRQ